MRQVDGTKVARLTLGGLPSCLVLLAPQGVGMGRQKSAEAVGAGPTGEGLNLLEKLDRFSDRLEQMPRERAQAGGSGRNPRDNAGRFIGRQALRTAKRRPAGTAV
jgi:hypothetical protein